MSLQLVLCRVPVETRNYPVYFLDSLPVHSVSLKRIDYFETDVSDTLPYFMNVSTAPIFLVTDALMLYCLYFTYFAQTLLR